MKVKNWIQKKPITIGRAALLQEAIDLMKRHSIRHLPVIDEGELVGFITEGDIKQFFFPSMVEDISVHQVMVVKPVTIDADASIEEAARLIHEHKIGGLPVLKDGKLVGVITASDLLSAFIQVMGLLTASSRIDVIIGKSGIEDVTRIINLHDCEIISVATESNSANSKVHYFRFEKCGDLESVVNALKKAGHQVLSAMD